MVSHSASSSRQPAPHPQKEQQDFLRQLLESHVSGQLRRIAFRRQTVTCHEAREMATEEAFAWYVLAGYTQEAHSLLQELRGSLPAGSIAVPGPRLSIATDAIANGQDPLGLGYALSEAVTHSPNLSFRLQELGIDLQHLHQEPMQVLLYTAALPGLEHLLAFQTHQQAEETRARHSH
jgi:hypothetical protein